MTVELNTIVRRLLRRRMVASQAYDRLLAEPASYSIQGSVSVTSQKLAELRREIEEIDRTIAAVCGKDSGGIRRSYPNYRQEAD